MNIGAEGLLPLERIVVPRSAIGRSQTCLRAAGKLGNEAIALWVGQWDGSSFHVREALCPRQYAVRSCSGCCVVVDHVELFALNRYLDEHAMMIGAQIHSHPRDAYHSDTDDQFPIATVLGSFSVVVPNFATDEVILEQCAVYRLLAAGQWSLIEPSTIRSLFHIEEDL